MVRLWVMLVLLIALGCGSRRKQVHQERERVEHSTSTTDDRYDNTQRSVQQNTLVLADEQGETETNLYNPDGTINPDGSFTGRADSAKVRSSARRSQASSQETTSSQDSTSTSSTKHTEQAVSEAESDDTSVAVYRAIPWYVWAGIAVLVAFSLCFGTPLKRIFKPFKR